jgi:hypothetical protein
MHKGDNNNNNYYYYYYYIAPVEDKTKIMGASRTTSK